MKYNVTEVQYNNLIKARDNWPEKLDGMMFADYDLGCTIVYLGRMMK